MFLNNDSGLKEYIGANPEVHQKYATTVVNSKSSDASIPTAEYEDAEVQDEFYDAIAADSSSTDEESDENEDIDQKVYLLKNIFFVWLMQIVLFLSSLI